MTTTQTKWLLSITSLVGAGAAGLWLIGAPSPPPSVPPGADFDEAHQSPATTEQGGHTTGANRTRGCSFEPEEQLAYSLVTVNEADLDLSGFGTSSQVPTTTDVRATAEARLELRALSSDPREGSVLVGRFAHFEANTIVEDAELQAPFLIRIAPDCTIDGFAHRRGVDAGYARVQQALLHEMSWKWPADRQGRFEGRRANGVFGAAISQSVIDGQVALTQVMTSFEPWAQRPNAATRVTDSHQRVVPGDVAWFETLEARASFDGPRSRSEHQVRVTYRDDLTPSLEAVPTDEADYIWADLLPHEIALNERQPPTPAELRALANARELSVDEAIDAYVERVEDDEVGIQDTWPPLRTFLEARPEQAAAVIERMKRQEMPSEATMGAYIALGNARTAQARAALEGVMRDEHAPVIERSRAILALIDRPDVGSELASYLGDQSRALASGQTSGARVMARQSLLALGAMSGRKPYDADIRQIALSQINTLVAEYRDKGAPYQRPIFGALANIGDPDSLQLVAHIPNHPDRDVREAAAIVFRRMPPQAAAPFAERWLAVETDANVKRSLWHTIELQTFDARQMTSRAVIEFALRDLRQRPGVITRKALIRLLARARELMPKDDLGIAAAFADLMPFEFDEQSGFHRMMHDHIDPVRREQIYREVAAGYEGDERPPSSAIADFISTVPADGDMTPGGRVLPDVAPAARDRGETDQ